jgi:predicted benzoate:H+ symporter BenE
MKIIIFLCTFLVSSLAFADDGSFLDSLQKIIDGIPVDGSVVLIGATVLEFVFRLFKTEKPKSIIYMVADCVKMFGAGLTKVGTFLDKVLPQRLK